MMKILLLIKLIILIIAIYFWIDIQVIFKYAIEDWYYEENIKTFHFTFINTITLFIIFDTIFIWHYSLHGNNLTKIKIIYFTLNILVLMAYIIHLFFHINKDDYIYKILYFHINTYLIIGLSNITLTIIYLTRKNFKSP